MKPITGVLKTFAITTVFAEVIIPVVVLAAMLVTIFSIFVESKTPINTVTFTTGPIIDNTFQLVAGAASFNQDGSITISGTIRNISDHNIEEILLEVGGLDSHDRTTGIVSTTLDQKVVLSQQEGRFTTRFFPAIPGTDAIMIRSITWRR